MKNFLMTITSLQGVADSFKKIMQSIVGPILAIIGVAAVAYCIVLGVQYAKAEDAEGRKKVQGRLIGACIGAVIIFAGMTICFAVDWAKLYQSFSA